MAPSVLIRQAEAQVPPLHGPARGHLADHAVGTLVVIIVFLVLTTLFTALRFYSRWIMLRRFLLTEWLILATQFVFYGYCVACIIDLFQGGIGAHVQDLGTAELILSQKISLTIQILYAVTMGTVKISVCLLYLDLFPMRWARICSWSLIAINSAWMLMTILIGLLICVPISANWDPSSGTCGDQIAAYTSVSAIELCIDALIIALPLPIIWNLKMSKGAKVATSSLFCLGLVTMITTGVRLHAIRSLDFMDYSYTSVDIFIWTTVEPAVALIMASAMGLRPLFEKVVPGLIGVFTDAERSKPTAGGTAGASTHQMNTFRKSKIRMTGFETISDEEDTLALSEPASAANASWVADADAPEHSGINVKTEISVESTKREE